jgi:hypothetical protein
MYKLEEQINNDGPNEPYFLETTKQNFINSNLINNTPEKIVILRTEFSTRKDLDLCKNVFNSISYTVKCPDTSRVKKVLELDIPVQFYIVYNNYRAKNKTKNLLVVLK